jgi:hypothetical protein
VAERKTAAATRTTIQRRRERISSTGEAGFDVLLGVGR